MLNAATETLGIYDIPIEKCWRDGLFFDSDTCSGFLICDKGIIIHLNLSALLNSKFSISLYFIFIFICKSKFTFFNFKEQTKIIMNIGFDKFLFKM